MAQDSFFGSLSTDQISNFITQAENELSRREDPFSLKTRWRSDELHKLRAERFGLPTVPYSIETSDVGGKLLFSRKERADYFDDTKVIRRNRKQRLAFVAFLDDQLDNYARERDQIYADREREQEREDRIFSIGLEVSRLSLQ